VTVHGLDYPTLGALRAVFAISMVGATAAAVIALRIPTDETALERNRRF
jgi:hypothetical protein